MESSPLMKTPYASVFEEPVHPDSLYDYQRDGRDRRAYIPIILSVVILLSFIGNIVVAVITVCCLRLRSVTSVFVLNLAVSDLLFSARLVVVVYDYIWGLSLEAAECIGLQYVFLFGFYSSLFLLVLMSVHRYTTTMHPFSGWKNRRRVTCTLISAWVASTFAALTVTVYDVARDPAIACRPVGFVSLMLKEAVIFVFAFFLMGFCYVRILQTIFRSPPNHRNRTTGLVLVLVATFFVCWAPYIVVNLLDHITRHVSYTNYIFLLLASTRCCLNPVIYGLFSVKFCKEMREILQRRATPNSAHTEVEESPLAGPVPV